MAHAHDVADGFEVNGAETMIEVETIELTDEKAKLILKNTNNAFVNSLRRIMLSEVPTMAIDEVNIYDNTSVLFDEQIALRLALIPLKTDMESYSIPSECSCGGEGCTQCQVSLVLNAEGPKVVYSEDLISTDQKIVPADQKIPIIELKDGQKLFLEAIARPGLGRDHAKWQAGIACGYKNMPRITITNCDQCNACVEECAPNILKPEGGTIVVTDPLRCTLCRLCEDVCEVDAIKVEEDERTILFNFETDGSYTARELLLQSANILQRKVRTLRERLQTLQ